jgi:acyl dehydratase
MFGKASSFTLGDEMSGKASLRSLRPLVGREIAVSEWMTMAQERINRFAECTEDRQWIHVDEERARRGPLGGTVAHGFLLLSLLPHLTGRSPVFQMRARMFVNYGLDRVRFTSPVGPGARFRNRAVLKAIRRKGFRKFLLTIENTIEVEGRDKPAMIAELLVLVYP